MSFDLFGQIGIKDSQYSLMVPTGTLLDLITGTFVPGENGSVICDGGIAPTNGIHGPPGSFKSTVSDGFVVNALERFQFCMAFSLIYHGMSLVSYKVEKKHHGTL